MGMTNCLVVLIRDEVSEKISSLLDEDNALPDKSCQHIRPFKDSPQALDKI